ncbi:BPTI/Kunitz domain-containing protein [Poseidonibacter lekithochrous]|uniref:BPTI/Kunitz domain-containing protein n=1 Tax=Poseidonibacter TaxID=2321187 RepID=UPI001C0953A8|nr:MULTISPECIES: BPTI/Kunitz domain-containing protein [Poseidonibacter]MBU3014421.1 BPTI/Kunitz domain-containing protein [Poseidonibacter lekithochrous]MDO6827719.1 BPTI/Kunitz domain-containing protein [Poseidonibacter sp. 1_MG-2023]
MITKLSLILLALVFTSCASTKEVPLPKKCFEKPNGGMCKAYFKKYYFDANDKKCKSFVWGGCQGNIPFNTLNECKSTCEK